MSALVVAVLAPFAFTAVFGLLYVLLPPPLDKKALKVLKLRPAVSAQILNLIRHLRR